MNGGVTLVVEPVLLCVGVVLCLFGWKLYRLSITFLGLFGGGVLGWLLATIIQAFVAPEEPSPFWVDMLGIGIGALVGVLLFRLMATYAFFILGSVIGGSLAHLGVINAPRLETNIDVEQYALWLYLVLPIILGFLFVFFQRSTMIVLTALSGVALITLAISHWMMIILSPAFLLGSVAAQTHFFKQSQRRQIELEKQAAEAAKNDREG